MLVFASYAVTAIVCYSLGFWIGRHPTQAKAALAAAEQDAVRIEQNIADRVGQKKGP